MLGVLKAHGDFTGKGQRVLQRVKMQLEFETGGVSRALWLDVEGS